MKKLLCTCMVIFTIGLGTAFAQTTNIPNAVLIGADSVNPDNPMGSNSLGVGEGNGNFGSNSVAIGYYSYAIGDNSLAVGDYFADAGGYGSVALGEGEPYGSYGFAANYGSVYPWSGAPSANYAAAFNGGYASADYAFAANFGFANNMFSSAFGLNTVTADNSQFVVGMYNRVVGTNPDWTNGTAPGWTSQWNWSGWVPGDTAIFIVGNGNQDTRSNAMQVRKDGMVLINPCGELGSGSYTNGPTP